MFMVNQLIGFGVAGAGNPDIVVTYVSAASSSAGTATHTYSAVTLGGTSADKIVVVVSGGGANSNTVSGVTVDGVSATPAVSQLNSQTESSIWAVAATGDATGDIVLTFTGTKPRSNIAWWRMTNAAGVTAHATASDTTSTFDVDINLPAGGALFAVGCGNNTPTNVAFTGPTRDAHILVSDLRMGGASMVSASAVTPQNVEVVFTSGSELSACAASFAKA